VTAPEPAPLMLSALQHYLFCPRQCALIHIEGAWAENYLTASGRQLHERVDGGVRETRRDVHVATSLRLFSHRLGLTGVADVVEFRRMDADADAGGTRVAVSLPGREGLWRPFPVEYKRGKPKPHRADEVQLCAQVLCLEEMLSVTIDAGALFYGETRRRQSVVFDLELRHLTEETIAAVRRLIEKGVTPPPILTEGCAACSLVDVCRPERMSAGSETRNWIDRRLREEFEVSK